MAEVESGQFGAGERGGPRERRAGRRGGDAGNRRAPEKVRRIGTDGFATPGPAPRKAAEFDNYKKRTEAEALSVIRYANEDLLLIEDPPGGRRPRAVVQGPRRETGRRQLRTRPRRRDRAEGGLFIAGVGTHLRETAQDPRAGGPGAIRVASASRSTPNSTTPSSRFRGGRSAPHRRRRDRPRLQLNDRVVRMPAVIVFFTARAGGEITIAMSKRDYTKTSRSPGTPTRTT